jgi:deazaflavin-dependent oxidoreductase (nitroreductase family)
MEPGWFTTNVGNRFVAWLARRGLSIAGSRTLTIKGRKSGEPRTTPVNPLDFEGQTYLVAPRGNTQWVRNLRAASEGDLKLGRKTRRFRGHEITDADKLPILKAYLDKWAWEVGAFFELPKNPTDEQIAEIEHLHPIFRVEYLG